MEAVLRKESFMGTGTAATYSKVRKKSAKVKNLCKIKVKREANQHRNLKSTHLWPGFQFPNAVMEIYWSEQIRGRIKMYTEPFLSNCDRRILEDWKSFYSRIKEGKCNRVCQHFFLQLVWSVNSDLFWIRTDFLFPPTFDRLLFDLWNSLSPII